MRPLLGFLAFVAMFVAMAEAVSHGLGPAAWPAAGAVFLSTVLGWRRIAAIVVLGWFHTDEAES